MITKNYKLYGHDGHRQGASFLTSCDFDVRTTKGKRLLNRLTHEYGHFIQRHAEVDYVPKNVFGMRALGGKLMGVVWKYDINTVYSRNGKIDASKISKYATESPYEAFAEGFLAMEKGENVPDSIATVIKEAMRKAGVKSVCTKNAGC